MVTLDDVGFDLTGFEPRAATGVRAFSSPAGDGVGIYFFALAPDIDAPLDDLAALRAAYRGKVEAAGLGVVEIETVQVAGCRAVRTISKAPQEPSGRTYLGAITLPFRDFSFVLKVQAAETGVTGVRDSIVFAKLKAAGAVTLGPDGARGWLADPYEPARTGPLIRNRSEDVEYDSSFPDHPLTRVRAVLAHIAATGWVSDAVRAASPFGGSRV